MQLATAHARSSNGHRQSHENGSDPMYARRIFAAAAIAIATAACSGGSPTLSSNQLADGPRIPDAPPTDTSGFVPPSMTP
jgi:hypothetical protein